MLLTSLVVTLALAQEGPADLTAPSPARRCADAATGSEVEICLQLAAQHPHDTNAIAAALRAHVDRRSAEDRDILQALLLLLSDEGGAEGAAQLGLVGDPRAIPPLEHAVRTREAPVATAAVAALARYPQALQPLSAFLLDPDLPIAVRIASAEALGRVGGADAGDVLLSALRRRNVPAPLRQAMIEALREHMPDRLAELDYHVSTDGSVWLALGAGWGLGYTLYATGSFGQTNLGPLGAGSGAIAGGTAGFLVGRGWPMEAGDAAFVTTSGIAGTLGGALMFSALDDAADAGYSGLAGGLLGEVAGYGLGMMLREAHPGTAADSVEAAAFAGISALAVGSGAVHGDNARNSPELGAGVGLLGGIVVGHALAPRIELTPPDSGIIALGATYGYVLGQGVPLASGTERWPLPVTGAATGALVGYAVAGMIDPTWDSVVGGLVGMNTAGALGLGVGLLVQDTLHVDPATPALIGATGGLVLGSWWAISDPQPLEISDAAVVTLASGWAMWQSVGWQLATTDRTRLGWPLVFTSLGAGGAALASPYLDVPVTSSLAATSLGLWGGYVAGVGAQLGGRDVLVYSLVGSNAGLLVGTVAMSPLLNTPPLVVGLADAGGVLGGSLFALGASFATDDPDVILLGSLIGAGVGFTGGAIAGGALQGSTRDIAWRPRPPRAHWALMPTAFPGEDGPTWGAVLEVRGW